eukprot:1727826-Pleurochrysis_carterae.AAC.1
MYSSSRVGRNSLVDSKLVILWLFLSVPSSARVSLFILLMPEHARALAPLPARASSANVPICQSAIP